MTGKRTQGGYEFHYNGWKQNNDANPSFVREGATKDNIFPEVRKSRLDGDLLAKMGLTKERMANNDVLFFYQLLVPLCDPKQSGIVGDPRQPFYTDVAKFTNSYAIDVRQGK